MRAAGPSTRFVLGTTAVMDVIVVSLFAVAVTVTKVLLGCSEAGSPLTVEDMLD